MGIPAYFKWISEKYPHIMEECIEYVKFDPETGEEHPVDASEANPNGVEFDNLYLDMNGIIHPCTHPEDGPTPKNEEEMFTAIFDYIDRIFAIVRPRKLLYLAIDGVAPRAKINQQRSRRFRAAQEHEQKLEMQKELASEWFKDHKLVDDDENSEQSGYHFDSNVITPGTPFMARLAAKLRAYVAQRIEDVNAWRDIVVVFSDASVPGEGEHKIAEFIRRERTQPGYNPSIKHVMYGLDADLIMLALATHEANFTILREEVFPKCDGQRQGALSVPTMAPAQSIPGQAQYVVMKLRSEVGGKKPFHFLHVHSLREYLNYEFKDDIAYELSSSRSPNIVYDLERVIDDFVFMCFFVGNDFLPHLPTLDIREGAIDYLIELYKTEVVRIGYLTTAHGEVDFVRVRQLLHKVAQKEEEVFKERLHRKRIQDERVKDQQRQKGKQARSKEGHKRVILDLGGSDDPLKTENLRSAKKRLPQKESKDRGYQGVFFSMPTVELGRKTGTVFGLGSGEGNTRAAESVAAKLKHIKAKNVKEESNSETSEAELMKARHLQLEIAARNREAAGSEMATSSLAPKRKLEFREALKQRLRAKNKCAMADSVMLGEDGWKERYYDQKFGWRENQRKEKQVLLQKYNEGLQWVMKYYYVGCISWGWFYPFHYAPFASDLIESEAISSDMIFELGNPFEPFTQLQAVMPASSGKLVLPTCYSDLMVDPNSPILDYYPADFDVDLNGKRFAWQGVVLLPFIDESRLNAALLPLNAKLSKEERHRNTFGRTCILIHKESRMGRILGKNPKMDSKQLTKISLEEAGGYLFGKVSERVQCRDHKRKVLTLTFEVPDFLPHRSEILQGASTPPMQLDDWAKTKSRSCGWKPARFGPLGRAAREIASDRQRRMATIGRRNPGPTRGRREQLQSDRPIINRPLHDMGGPMFGRLPASASSLPRWVRGMHDTQNSHRGHSGGWRQGVYGVETGLYKPTNRNGGYFASAGNVETARQASQAWGSGASWHTHFPTPGQQGITHGHGYRPVQDGGRQHYGNRPEYDGSHGGLGWYDRRDNGVSQHQSHGLSHFHPDQNCHYQNIEGCCDEHEDERVGSGRRGLSGPTAASMRRGRGRSWGAGEPGRGGAY
ncbi:unnamed protein product [Agarophyton chilense]|eukprot:gb/GEZJ01000427.1/.p1 GENE.gb/GEZJ01000427.1/~~gb/GEZJ01000427.1/.p1  ORF type:complete len:1124 (+),score=152.53 gb/GEZJ01000427.1/:431-3802(+)